MDGLATCSDVVRIWDVGGGDLGVTATVNVPAAASNSCCWNHNGQVVATAGTDGSIMVLKVCGTIVHAGVMSAHALPIRGIAFSSKSRKLAAGGDAGVVEIWDLKRNNSRVTVGSRRSPVTCVAFFDRDTRVAAGEESGRVALYRADANAANEKKKKAPVALPLSGGNASVTDLAASPGGPALLGVSHSDGAVRLWDAGRGECVREIKGQHAGEATSISFHPHGQNMVATVGLDGVVRCADMRSGERGGRVALSAETGVPLTCVSFHSEGAMIAVGASDGTVRLVDLRAPASAVGAEKTPKNAYAGPTPPAGGVRDVAFQKPLPPGAGSNSTTASAASSAGRSASANGASTAAHSTSSSNPRASSASNVRTTAAAAARSSSRGSASRFGPGSAFGSGSGASSMFAGTGAGTGAGTAGSGRSRHRSDTASSGDGFAGAGAGGAGSGGQVRSGALTSGPGASSRPWANGADTARPSALPGSSPDGSASGSAAAAGGAGGRNVSRSNGNGISTVAARRRGGGGNRRSSSSSSLAAVATLAQRQASRQQGERGGGGGGGGAGGGTYRDDGGRPASFGGVGSGRQLAAATYSPNGRRNISNSPELVSAGPGGDRWPKEGAAAGAAFAGGSVGSVAPAQGPGPGLAGTERESATRNGRHPLTSSSSSPSLLLSEGELRRRREEKNDSFPPPPHTLGDRQPVGGGPEATLSSSRRRPLSMDYGGSYGGGDQDGSELMLLTPDDAARRRSASVGGASGGAARRASSGGALGSGDDGLFGERQHDPFALGNGGGAGRGGGRGEECFGSPASRSPSAILASFGDARSPVPDAGSDASGREWPGGGAGDEGGEGSRARADSGREAARTHACAGGGLDRSMLEQVLSKHINGLREELRQELRNLHVDMLRQFHSLQDEQASAMSGFEERLGGIVAENQALRAENDRLRRVY